MSDRLSAKFGLGVSVGCEGEVLELVVRVRSEIK